MLVALARAAGTSVDFLATGNAVGSTPTKEPASENTIPNYGKDYIPVRRVTGSKLDEQAARTVTYESRLAWLPLEWIRDGLRGGNVNSLAMLRMAENVMEPELLTGEIVIIDTSARELEEGMLAVRVENNVTVRYVVQLGKGSYAFRHNQHRSNEDGYRFSAEQLGRDCDILGRIVVLLRYPVFGQARFLLPAK